MVKSVVVILVKAFSLFNQREHGSNSAGAADVGEVGVRGAAGSTIDGVVDFVDRPALRTFD